jgi:hypothetical protein
MEAYQGIKRIKDILSGAGIKGRIKVGPELIGIGSVLNIAYIQVKRDDLFMLNIGGHGFG